MPNPLLASETPSEERAAFRRDPCVIATKTKFGIDSFLPMQPCDVYQTYADVEPLMRDFGFKPSTPIEEGLSRFCKMVPGILYRRETLIPFHTSNTQV